MILEKAFGSATKRHKRRKEIEQKPQCLAMNPFTQQVKHARNNSVTSLLCFVLLVLFCGNSTAGFRMIGALGGFLPSSLGKGCFNLITRIL
jgi:hypothetical protein